MENWIEKIATDYSEHIEFLNRVYPNRHKEIHKVCCKNCPSKKGHDPETLDIKNEMNKEVIAKEILFVCAWRNSKLCKGYCDLMEIDQDYLNEKISSPE